MVKARRTFVIGDIHGRSGALAQVLDRAKFRFDTDRLINLGDTCDGGRQTRQCFDILLKIKNRVDILGNHDHWAYKWMITGEELPIWVHQGGYNTMYSYGYDLHNVPIAHSNLIKNSLTYYIDENNRIYVHGGFNPIVPIENQKTEFIVWDRTLIQYARTHNINTYKHVFVGHTTTQIIRNGWTEPITFNNLTMVDCGGGWNGRLALINVNNLGDTYLSDIQNPNYEDDAPCPDKKEWSW